jgi:hypothetical protein
MELKQRVANILRKGAKLASLAALIGVATLCGTHSIDTTFIGMVGILAVTAFLSVQYVERNVQVQWVKYYAKGFFIPEAVLRQRSLPLLN